MRDNRPLNPTSYNNDIGHGRGNGKGDVRRDKIGEESIYTLAYADNVVLLVKEEDEMRSMIGRLKEYIDRKGLELNVGKTKIMKFKNGEGRTKKRK